MRQGALVPRLVVDTNVLVSSLFGRASRQLVELWREGRVTLCLSEEIMAEYLQVLPRFASVRDEARDLLALLAEGKHTVRVEPGEALQHVTDDPDDAEFLACALAAEADAIVSSDVHLLALRAFRGIPILTPGALLERLSSGDGSR